MQNKVHVKIRERFSLLPDFIFSSLVTIQPYSSKARCYAALSAWMRLLSLDFKSRGIVYSSKLSSGRNDNAYCN